MSSDSANPGVFKETAQALDKYWFGFGSPTALGVFRIVMGSLVAYNTVLLSFDWNAWFSERGFVPVWLGERFLWPRVYVGFGTDWTVPRIDILSGITNDRIGLLVFILTGVAAILTALGLWTRISTIALAIGVVSLHHRNSAILHGGDTVVRLGCLYLAIAPSGAACSLDRLIGILKGKISSAPVLVSMWPQRLIAFNAALIYLTTVWSKWGGHLWENGLANWYPSRLSEFERFPVPSFLNNLPAVYFTTYATLAIEFSLGTLVFFRPLRNYVLLGGVLLHGFIEYSMNIPLFSYLVISLYICFYDGEEVAAWAERRGLRWKRFHVNVHLPKDTRLKPSAVTFLDSIDPLKLIHYFPGDEADWTASKQDGTSVRVWPTIWKRSLGCWIFGWYPAFWKNFQANALEPMEPEAPRPSRQPMKHKR